MKSKLNVGFGVLIILAIMLAFGFKKLETKISINDYEPIRKDVKITGSQLFQNNCAVCHGAERQGKPPTFPSLVDINQKLSKNQISELLKTGRNSMPGFSHLSESERNAIVAYIYGEDIESGIVTAVSPIENGKSLFIANCTECHQQDQKNSFTTQQRGWGMKPPNLNGVSDWISAGQFKQILNIGPCYMPSFVAMEDKNKEDIYAYLSTLEGSYNNTNSRKRRGCGCRMGMR